MGFEIHNPQGKEITLEELEKEVQWLWSQVRPIHTVQYTSPHPLMLNSENNWVAVIGQAIAHPRDIWANKANGTTHWVNIKNTLSIAQSKIVSAKILQGGDLMKEIEEGREYLKPYLELIDYWRMAGYTFIKTA